MSLQQSTSDIWLGIKTAASLPTEGRYDFTNKDGLNSEEGIKGLVEWITLKKSVKQVVLDLNDLGDEACEKIFDRLSKVSLGRDRGVAIRAFSLNSNGIGNRGLLSICRYVEGNTSLKELFLHDNLFVADSIVTSALVGALHNSSIELLALNSNASLSDEFVTNFLPSLNAPHLKELHLSSMNLSLDSAQAIVDFISCQSRCRLRTFKCNGNRLGLRGVSTIADAVERHNYYIKSVELKDNRLDSDKDDGQWDETEETLARALKRNSMASEAFSLLKYSRNLFYGSSVPEELQGHILSFLDHTLSAAERGAVVSHAMLSETLPRDMTQDGGCNNKNCMKVENAIAICCREQLRKALLDAVNLASQKQVDPIG